MKIPTFPFRHAYYKLAQDEFTTIRGKTQFKRLKVGQQANIESPGNNFPARITALELRRVTDLPVALLKADAEYPGCTITTHQQFINLLNSFRAPMWSKVGPDSELTIITLKKYDNRCIKDECHGMGHCNCESCIADRRGD